jgi:hypothetical protein
MLAFIIRSKQLCDTQEHPNVLLELTGGTYVVTDGNQALNARRNELRIGHPDLLPASRRTGANSVETLGTTVKSGITQG